MVDFNKFLPLGKVGPTQLYGFEDIVFYQAGLEIDADGSPHAYHPSDWGSRSEWVPKGREPYGFDAPENGGKAQKISPGVWKVTESWGWAVQDSGLPVIQKETDLAPGYYVSTTALVNPNYPKENPLRYVNSEIIPFIVWPARCNMGNISLGDIALIKYKDKKCLAIVADIGPRGKIGEGSMALAKALQINANPRHGGTSSGVSYFVFSGSGDKTILSTAQITDRAFSYLKKLGEL